MPNTKPQVTFSWRNYTKPTPANLEAVATSLRRIVALIAGTTIVMEAVWWVPFTVLVIGGILDELKNFFAKASAEYNEIVSINIPPGAEDKVEITQEEKPKE
jgi:hypothetical protein